MHRLWSASLLTAVLLATATLAACAPCGRENPNNPPRNVAAETIPNCPGFVPGQEIIVGDEAIEVGNCSLILESVSGPLPSGNREQSP